MMTRIETIKNRLSCPHFCKERINDSLEGVGDKKASPLPGSPSNSLMQVWKHSFIDWGTRTCGDVIDLCAAMEYDGDRGKAMSDLAHWTGTPDPYPHADWEARMQAFGNRCAYWHQHLTDEHRAALNRAGVTDATIDRLMLGTITDGPLAGFIAIPHRKNGYIAFYTAMADDVSEVKKANLDGYAEPVPFGLQTISKVPNRTTVILAGNPMQAVLAEQTSTAGAGWSVLGAMGNQFTKQHLEFIVPLLKEHQRVVVFDDMESDFADRTADALARAGVNFSLCSMQEYLSGVALQEAVEAASDGVAAVAKKLRSDDIKGLERLCKTTCRYRSKTEVAALFASLAETEKWPAEVLKALKKESEIPPSEDEVARAVGAEHDLIYSGNYGFSEFDGIRWSPLSEPAIHRYISEEYGHHRTGAKVKSVTTLVKADSVTGRLMNQKSIMNFPNGTLEIDEDRVQFRSHRADDLCTTVTSYPYDTTAKCPEWEHFIESVADHDRAKMKLLQEVAGYVLVHDNGLFQSAVFFKGEGSNGKSVFLEVLEKVFDEESVSHVKLKDLEQDFQRVKLSGSILNICEEASDNAERSINDFKNLVAGGKTSACYKGKDYFDFVPRCKFFVACNQFPRLYDPTRAFIRRCIVINFPVIFVADREPVRENERKADLNLKQKLTQKTSLSGIFNWCLEGYFRLLKQGKFTETEDSNEVKNELRELTNPLYKFMIWLKEQPLPQELTTKEFYEYYKTFCNDFGYNKPLTLTSFGIHLKPLIDENMPDWKHFRTAKANGYRRI